MGSIDQGKAGYRHHPETVRWAGALKALYFRHDRLVEEMSARGYHHRSPLQKRQATGRAVQRRYVHTLRQQREILRAKGCSCRA